MDEWCDDYDCTKRLCHWKDDVMWNLYFYPYCQWTFFRVISIPLWLFSLEETLNPIQANLRNCHINGDKCVLIFFHFFFSLFRWSPCCFVAWKFSFWYKNCTCTYSRHRTNTIYYCRQGDTLEHKDKEVERECHDAKCRVGKRKKQWQRRGDARSHVYVCARAMKEAELLYNPEGTSLSFLQNTAEIDDGRWEV